jgi:inner membrane protein
MDSLTQIVLGAAVGEAVLGKKVGNRAVLWGGIAGTIPDLDVIANQLTTPLQALALHRGPTHGLIVCAFLAFILGWLVHRMYLLSWHKWLGVAGWSLLVAGAGLGIMAGGKFSATSTVSGLVIVLVSGWIIWRRYFVRPYESPEVRIWDWQKLFLWSLITHPILDCFTTYGTQIFWPFSDMRVAFNNIAVADPLYTVPFLLCLSIAMYYPKSSPRRVLWNNRGLIISCLYMALTLFNKTRVNTVFESSLMKQGIEWNRYMTNPTILNNVLWSGVAETDSAFYYGQYSFFDSTKVFQLHRLDKTPVDLEQKTANDHTINTLRWFSDDYYVFSEPTPDSIYFYDLRFGTFKMKRTDPEKYVFKFNIHRDNTGNYVLKDQGERPRDANFREAFGALWDRIMGRTMSASSTM